MRDFREIIYEEEESGLAVVKLNRPDRLNALGMNLAEEVCALADDLSKSGHVRAVILTGEGRAFSTGRDLKESATHSKEEADRFQQLAMDAVVRWSRLPMPTVAAINGAAFGWGVEVALGCDMRYAAEDATLCFPETALGVFPGAGASVRLARLIPPGLAKELIFTAKRFDGREAERIALVSRALPQEELMDAVCSLAGRICENGPLGVRGAKKVIDTSLDMPMDGAIAYSNEIRLPLNQTKDFAEALAAFREKRKPRFRGE